MRSGFFVPHADPVYILFEYRTHLAYQLAKYT